MPSATCPLAPLSDLLPLAVALWGSFARLFVVLSPSWTPVFACFGPCFPCPLFVFSLLLGSSLAVAPLCGVFLLVFLPAFLRLSSLWPLCAAFGVVGLPCLLFLLCCGRLPSPAGCCLPPPFGCSLAASWSSYCAGPSLWVSGCFM